MITKRLDSRHLTARAKALRCYIATCSDDHRVVADLDRFSPVVSGAAWREGRTVAPWGRLARMGAGTSVQSAV
jgi:hypothetical protein